MTSFKSVARLCNDRRLRLFFDKKGERGTSNCLGYINSNNNAATVILACVICNAVISTEARAFVTGAPMPKNSAELAASKIPKIVGLITLGDVGFCISDALICIYTLITYDGGKSYT